MILLAVYFRLRTGTKLSILLKLAYLFFVFLLELAHHFVQHVIQGFLRLRCLWIEDRELFGFEILKVFLAEKPLPCVAKDVDNKVLLFLFLFHLLNITALIAT